VIHGKLCGTIDEMDCSLMHVDHDPQITDIFLVDEKKKEML
jgi:hypothetical protein